MSEGNLFQLKIITPERVFFEGEVSMVEIMCTLTPNVLMRITNPALI